MARFKIKTGTYLFNNVSIICCFLNFLLCGCSIAVYKFDVTDQCWLVIDMLIIFFFLNHYIVKPRVSYASGHNSVCVWLFRLNTRNFTVTQSISKSRILDRTEDALNVFVMTCSYVCYYSILYYLSYKTIEKSYNALLHIWRVRGIMNYHAPWCRYFWITIRLFNRSHKCRRNIFIVIDIYVYRE